MRLFSLSNFFFTCLFFTTGFLVFNKAIYSEFIYDDTLRIAAVLIEDGKIRFDPILPLKRGLGYVLGSALADRPLLMFTIWVNYIFGGADPIGYKVVNIFLHSFVGVLFYWFLLAVSDFFSLPKNRMLAGLIALVFIVHPLHNQAVTMVIQRGVILSTLFSLASLLSVFAFLDGKNWNYSLLAGFFFLCALLSKPNVLFFPLVVLIFSFVSGKKKDIQDVLIPMGIACVFPLWFYFGYQDNFHAQTYDAGSWVNYGLVQSKVIFHYLWQVVWPLDFNASYPIPLKVSLGQVWIFCLLHFTAVVGSVYFLVKRKNLLALAILSFYLALIPESSFFPIPHVVFDHRMYFPFLFLALGVYVSLVNRKRLSLLSYAVFVPVIFAFGLKNDHRNSEIQTYLKWIVSSARKNPQDNLVGLNAINVLWSAGSHSEGHSLASLLWAANRESPEYLLFVQLFSLTSLEEKQDAVEKILFSPQFDFLTSISRTNLIQWLVSRYKKLPDETRSREHIHVLLSDQSRFFSDEKYEPFRSFYQINFSNLHTHYLGLASKGLLQHYQRELWFGILQVLQGQAELLNSLERFYFYSRKRDRWEWKR